MIDGKNKYTALMSVYNGERAEYLNRALKSILEQTVLPNEFILIQDGVLNTRLEHVILNYKKMFELEETKFIIIKNDNNLGLALSLNKGLNICSNRIVARFDSDDINLKNRMESMLEIFNKNPNISVVGSWANEFKTKVNDEVSIKKVPETDEKIKKYAKHRNPMNHMTVVYDLSAVKKVNCYTNIPLFEDYYLWLKLMAEQFTFYNVQDSLVHVRADSNFVARRGGLKYFFKETFFQIKALRHGYFGLTTVLYNILTRGIIRLLPKKVLGYVYAYLRDRK